METKTKDSTIRWIGYPSILILANALAQKCADPDAFINKECEVDTGISIPVIILLIVVLESFLKNRREDTELEEKRKIDKSREDDEKYEQAAQEREEEFIYANKQEKQQIYRTDIIKKLGSVGNYLNHLLDPAYNEKQGLIRQQIATEFNDIIAKYPLAELREIVQKNEEIQHKLRSLDKKCNLHHIENDDLEIMLKLLPEN